MFAIVAFVEEWEALGFTRSEPIAVPLLAEVTDIAEPKRKWSRYLDGQIQPSMILGRMLDRRGD